jgi:hypothetical protein
MYRSDPSISSEDVEPASELRLISFEDVGPTSELSLINSQDIEPTPDLVTRSVTRTLTKRPGSAGSQRKGVHPKSIRAIGPAMLARCLAVVLASLGVTTE